MTVGWIGRSALLLQFGQDFAQQDDILGRGRRLGFLGLLKTLDEADQQEHHEGDDQEIDRDGDELAEAEQRDARLLEIGIAGGRALKSAGMAPSRTKWLEKSSPPVRSFR
jgi:hypothetical protein